MRRRILASLVLAALTLAGARAHAMYQESEDRGRQMAACRTAMADRNWGLAEERLSEFVRRWRGGDEVEEAGLLLARARLQAGRPEDALETLRTLVSGATGGLWSDKARWLGADAYAALRNWQGSADVLRARAEFLAGDDHQQSIADLYLEVADQAWEGVEEPDAYGRRTQVRNWPRALDFYRGARSVRLREADAPRVRHRIAQAAFETGDAASARTEWTSLLEDGVAAALEPEALYGLGRAYVRLGQLPEARRRFREVQDRFKDSDFAPRALIALGNTWSPLETGSRDDLDRGLEAWREFRRLYHGHEEGPGIAYAIGLALANFGDRGAAIDEWKAFLERWRTHEMAPEAVHGIALAHLGLEQFDEAAAAWTDLLAQWPNHSLWTTARAMLPKTAMARAEVEMREKRWDAAVKAFRRYLEEYPDDDDAAQGRLRVGDALEEAGKRDEAMKEWRLTVSKYPDDPRAPTAWSRVCSVLADKVGDLPAAIAEYEGLARRYGGSPEGRLAAATLAAMKGKELEAKQERPMTTDRRPRVAFRLRNVERLRMKVYRVDLEEYVRTKGTLAGAENVVTDVVKPDAEWVWRPENHERFRLLDRTCELPVDGPGAWIVRAQDEELSATLLVISSDLAAVVKRSGEQTFVYVQNERTGDPVAGARVLLPGGDGAITGSDGVWIGGAPRDGARVLVARDGHTAFAAGDTGNGTTFGYSTKVYLFPDRPLVRPGQSIALKGFARRVVSGSYACREGEKVNLVVEDPRRATVLRRTVLTDAFGGIDTSLTLPDEAALGEYRVTARYEDRTFSTQFAVRAFRKPELEVSVRGERPTWFVGDQVTASVRVRYGAGGDVRDAPVRWRVGRTGFEFDASSLESYASWFRDPAREAERRRRRAAEGDFVELASGETRTDDKGLCSVSFATDDAAGDGRYVLEVMVQDSGGTWVRDAAAFPVTGRGMYAVVRSERRVVRPRQDIPLEIFTVDALQDPLSATGRVVLARRRRVGDRMVDEEVSSVAATTGADGRAAVKVQAERPGEYALLFVTSDERGNAVKGRTTITVAGDAEDLDRDLRLVCDRETYREGDEAEILLNVPAVPATVLLTFEGERVLEHRVVRTTERSSTLRVAMQPLFAPNVFVRATVLRDGDLLESGDEVLVFRYLDVTVEPSGPTSLPGREVGVVIRTTDQRGNPVQASVAVAAVDRAIVQLEPDRTPDPRPYFYDQRRTLGVVTTSSWAHLPSAVTRPTNKDLLFEEARRLGREGFERMTRHVQRGRENLEAGRLAAALDEVQNALELSPGQHEARVLLARIQQQMSAVADEKRFSKASKSLGDELAKSELQDRAAETGARFKDKDLADARSRSDRPARKAPGSPAPEPSEAMPNDDQAFDMGEGESVGIGGGAGGMFGGRRGGHRNLRAQGGGGWGAPGLLAAQEPLSGSRERFEDLAYWNADVRTGSDGSATVTLSLPDNLTTWDIVARGASRDTLVGEGRSSVAARQPLLVRVASPRVLGQRDEATVGTVVHNETGEDIDAIAGLRTEGVGLQGAGSTQARLKNGEVRGFTWRIAGDAPGSALLTAEVRSAQGADSQKSALPILPHGLRHVRAASGTCRDVSVASLDLPANPVEGTVRLRVSIAPSLDGVLLAAVSWSGAFPYGCVEQTVHRFLPALSAEDALRRAGVPNLALRDHLDGAVEQGLLSLYSLQRDDGGFGWFGRTGEADPQMTAFALLGMLRAETQGHEISVNNRARAVAAAKNLLKTASPGDRALLLRALAQGGEADLGALNALVRVRESLDDRGLANLALALHRSGRTDRALDAVGLLKSRVVREADAAHWNDGSAIALRRGIPVDAKRPFVHDAESTALALQAILAVSRDDELVDPVVRWILDHRRGRCWRSTRDTAAVVDALAEVLVRRGVQRNEFSVKVFVNDGTEAVVTREMAGRSDGGGAVAEIDVPVDALHEGRNTVRLEKDGTGAFHWAARLEAFVDDEDIAASGNLLRVERRRGRYMPARNNPGADDGPPPVGWECCVPETRPGADEMPSVNRVGGGDLFEVTLSLEAREDLEYVMLEDPVPPGCEVVEGREGGGFDRFERRDDRVVFFLSRVPAGRTSLTYVLQGVFPGTYHALPAEAEAMYEPEIRGRSAEDRITVVPEPGAVHRRGDGETVSPDEVLFLARRALRERRWADARDGFRGLLRDWRLLPAIEVEAWAAVRSASLEIEDHRGAVEAHEALLERDPRRVPADRHDALRMAVAYHEIGEFERASALFRELADRFYAQEREVADAYASLGAPVRALTWRATVLLRYPDGALTDGEEVALCRDLASTRSPETGALLLPEAAERLRMVMSHRAELRNADEVGMMLVDVLRRMELADEAAREGDLFLARHPGSRWQDDVRWFLADAAFDGGDYDRAAAVAKPLLTEEYPRDDDPRRKDASPRRPNAWHLLGKIAHLRGDLAEAVQWYGKARDRIADAADAHAFLTEASLEVPDLVSFVPGSRPHLEIRRRNVGALDVRVYPVDFMILYSVRKDLSAVNRIDLTGIVPAGRIERTWSDATDRKWHEESLELPVTEQGVYLVHLKGNVDAASLVVLSNLRLEVQRTGPRLRVYVTDARDGRPVSEAYVKIAEGGNIQAQGFTDARGVFEAAQTGQNASVVVEKEGGYALHR